mmetsp:Transcript_3022/g.8731  ORF Transcript_3022/g.8731 Transcript_3022/m.8731 type:complete len:1063 (+) Transcript_3022:1610-4798(+)
MTGSEVCISCMDADEVVVFRCKGHTCTFQLCAGCVKLSFEDASGATSTFCVMCQTPSALDMIASVCGPAAIKAVEKKLRGPLEFKLREENLKRGASRDRASKVSDQARRLFNELTEKINLKCPRCKTVFNDYDGCNALSCGVPTCRAGFCAVCLKDCGSDAHKHIHDVHGSNSIFDKEAFKRNEALRVQALVDELKGTLSGESFELRQLVLNHIEKAKLTDDGSGAPNDEAKVARFLDKTKSDLMNATKKDRLALLSDPEDYNRRNGFDRNRISPRNSIPREYRLVLTHVEDDIYRYAIHHDLIEGEECWALIDDIEAHFKKYPKVESLLNVAQVLRCSVIAFSGQRSLYQTSRSINQSQRALANDEVCIQLNEIGTDGSVLDTGIRLFGGQHALDIIGLNQNKRMILLEKHIQEASNSSLMFMPLRHMIGAGNPAAALTEIEMGVPDSLIDLNGQQKRVAHPLNLKTAMEVAGPPGTGKTKTIVELVRSLLQCTSYDILLLSERNGAINAVAEKFKIASLKVKNNDISITDLPVWSSVMTYGAGDTMGDCTKLFTLEQKLSYHPEIVELKEKRDLLDKASKSLSKALRKKLSDEVLDFGSLFKEEYAADRSYVILKENGDLSSPLVIISTVLAAIDDIESAFDSITENHYLTEEATEGIIICHSTLLGRLVPIRTTAEKEDKRGTPWDKKEASRRLRDILKRFQSVLKLEIFNQDNARDLANERREVDQELRAVKSRLEIELPKLARFHMSTIGSSHRLPGDKNNDANSLDGIFDCLSLEDSHYGDDIDPPQNTVVVFDESGCIPAYELLGLSRLGRAIESLVLVGDKHQLPPYDPTSTRGRRFGGRNARHSKQNTKQTKSLLDVSALTSDAGKIVLSTQYRVPKDIADMLNQRVYRGQYNTAPKANVPLSGLRMVNVPFSEDPRRKYVNPNEVTKGLELLRELRLDHRAGISSILIITPYKNQQREFEFQMKRQGFTTTGIETNVLSIDQCQGQEADAVILSFVKRPTPFLTINRLNVALSRVRKKLFVLTDFRDLRDACKNKQWECAGLAGDLLLNAQH